MRNRLHLWAAGSSLLLLAAGCGERPMSRVPRFPLVNSWRAIAVPPGVDLPSPWAECRIGRRDVRAVAFSPDSSRVAVGHWDGTVRVCDAQSGKDLRVLKAHASQVEVLGFLDNSDSLVTAGGDHRIRVWDVTSGKLVREATAEISAYALAATGKLLAVEGHEEPTGHVVRLLSLPDLRLVKTIPSFRDGSAGGHLLSPGGEFLAAAGSVMNLLTGDLAHVRYRRGGSVEAATDWIAQCLAFSSDGRRVIVRGSDDPPGWVSSEPPTRLRVWTHQDSQVRDLPISPSMLGGKDACGLYLYGFGLAALSPDDNYLVFADFLNADVWIWDLRNARPVGRLTSHRDGMLCMAFSPDGKRLVTGSADGTAIVWKFEELVKHAERVHAAGSP